MCVNGATPKPPGNIEIEIVPWSPPTNAGNSVTPDPVPQTATLDEELRSVLALSAEVAENDDSWFAPLCGFRNATVEELYDKAQTGSRLKGCVILTVLSAIYCVMSWHTVGTRGRTSFKKITSEYSLSVIILVQVICIALPLGFWFLHKEPVRYWKEIKALVFAGFLVVLGYLHTMMYIMDEDPEVNMDPMQRGYMMGSHNVLAPIFSFLLVRFPFVGNVVLQAFCAVWFIFMSPRYDPRATPFVISCACVNTTVMWSFESAARIQFLSQLRIIRLQMEVEVAKIAEIEQQKQRAIKRAQEQAAEMETKVLEEQSRVHSVQASLSTFRQNAALELKQLEAQLEICKRNQESTSYQGEVSTH